MTSCPPPREDLAPPPVAEVSFLGGALKLSALVFFDAQSKRWSGEYTMRIRDHRQAPTKPGEPWKAANYKSVLIRRALEVWHNNCRIAWKNVSGNVKVSTMIGRGTYDWQVSITKPGWFGTVSALPPQPNETVGAYRARGGILLSRSMFDGRIPIDLAKPGWIDKHNTQVEGLELRMAVTQSDMTLKVVIQRPEFWNRVWDRIVNLPKLTCNKLTHDKLQMAAATAIAFPNNPKVMAAVGAYLALAAFCNMQWPSCPAPGAATGTLPPIKPIQATFLPIQATFLPPAPTYPPGSIAYFDKRASAYLIATPIGLAGVAATHAIAASSPTPPQGVPIVSWWTWENATKPLYRRTWFLATSAVTGVAVVGGAAAALSRR